MRHGRFITTALAVAATMAIAPSWAAAAPSPLTDDTMADFAAGTAGTDTWAVEPGAVRLKPATSDNFDGTSLNATAWSTTFGTPAVGSGALSLDGAGVRSVANSGGPQTLAFRATFGGANQEHAGLAVDLNDGPWAIFSTADGSGGTGFFARTRAAAGGSETVTPLTGISPTVPHVYRIDRDDSNHVTFMVDGAPVATNTLLSSIAMGAVASDLTADTTNVKVDWLDTGVMPSSGTFTSRVHQADDAHTVWGTVKETGAGSGAAFETRSGNTPAPDSTWSSWAAAGAGGAIQSPSGRRYIQYRATLSGTDPSLDKVELSYATDNVAPSATIGDPQVSGTTATVAFSSPDADIAGFECSLDQAAYAACTSPTAFTGLAAGAHTVYVRPIDKAGNTGSAVSKSFTIAAPAQGGGSQAGGGNSARDTVAPRVVLAVSSLRVTRRGTVAIRLGCPSTETRCTIKVALKRGKSTLAHKTVTVSGGKAVTVKLQLSKAIRRQLASRHRLKVTAVIAATDAAGNKGTTKRALTLRAPA